MITDILKRNESIYFNATSGAFYNTIVFKEGLLNNKQTLQIDDPTVKSIVEEWVNQPDVLPDKRFVYYLLAAKGICVVPISSFCSDLRGFRVTILETDEALLQETFTGISKAIEEYVNS